MAGVRKKGYVGFVSFLVGILIGGIVGSICVSILVSYRLDQFYEEIAELKNVIEEKNRRLVKLEDSINKQKFILKEIKIELIFQGDGLDEVALKKHIGDKYVSLLGKEVKNIDTEMLETIIDRRLMRISGNEYQLFMKKIVLTDVLEIWIKVEELE